MPMWAISCVSGAAQRLAAAGTAVLLMLMLMLAPHAAALRAYGHAYSRPDDFTDAQIAEIASRFEVFTVEKSTAENKYGPKSSIAATVGTSKRIKVGKVDAHSSAE